MSTPRKRDLLAAARLAHEPAPRLARAQLIYQLFNDGCVPAEELWRALDWAEPYPVLTPPVIIFGPSPRRRKKKKKKKEVL